jgi:hypothetical protein
MIRIFKPLTPARFPNRQTIEELNRLYAGHFNQQLYQHIRAINRNVMDPHRLKEGELIPLPLYTGASKQVVDRADPLESAISGTWHLLVATVREFLRQ